MFKGDTKNPPFSHYQMVKHLFLGLHLLDLLLVGHSDLLLAGAEHLPVDLPQVDVLPLDGLSDTVSVRQEDVIHTKCLGVKPLVESEPGATNIMQVLCPITTMVVKLLVVQLNQVTLLK